MSGTGTIQNFGTLNHAGGNTLTISSRFDNTGSVISSGATLDLSGGGTQTGSFTSVNSAGAIRFSGGTHDIADTVLFDGAGAFSATAGTINLKSRHRAAELDV